MENTAANKNLLSNISAAIRSSLGVSLAASSLMADNLIGKAEPEMQKYLAILRHNQFKLLLLVEKIEDFIADEKSAFSVMHAVDIVKLCSNLTDTVSALTAELGVNVSFLCVYPSLISVVDPIQIERMLLEIISNSLLHTPQGGSILVTLTSTCNCALVTVADTGGGIGDEKMECFFEDHIREKEPTEPRTAGLGMSSVAHLARIHGGSIAVTQTNGHTAVIVSLPLSDTDEPVLSVDSVLYGSGAMQRVLTGLADVLGYKNYYES